MRQLSTSLSSLHRWIPVLACTFGGAGILLSAACGERSPWFATLAFLGLMTLLYAFVRFEWPMASEVYDLGDRLLVVRGTERLTFALAHIKRVENWGYRVNQGLTPFWPQFTTVYFNEPGPFGPSIRFRAAWSMGDAEVKDLNRRLAQARRSE